jgi:enamine deaminase RidA (YjgF/YER057c/UK114 family)
MEGTIIGVGAPVRQTEQILLNIETALRNSGASLDDVVRTRIYVRDIKDWNIIGRVQGKYFGEIRPA